MKPTRAVFFRHIFRKAFLIQKVLFFKYCSLWVFSRNERIGAPHAHRYPAQSREFADALSHVQIVRVIALSPSGTDCLFGLATKLDGDANSINSEQGIAGPCRALPYHSRVRGRGTQNGQRFARANWVRCHCLPTIMGADLQTFIGRSERLTDRNTLA